ncbi:hypothetical protein [Magnetospira sp. QH-2]|uniref:hypothetical protein n=1 Tax=Magnetospira sp. (strain QH-2) TaxID=1288970 RepID=UPI0003E81A66|nr:hypothetical protein [Magnetospira sp. QH-2]CCQ72094.1 conserved protein of unknown function [Magnetospira sp. QH-2]
MGPVSAATLFRILIWMLLLAVIGVGALWGITEDRPLVTRAAVPDSEDARQLRSLLHGFRLALNETTHDHHVSLSPDRVAGLSALAMRGLGQNWPTTAVIKDDALEMRGTIPLPRMRFLNIALSVENNDRGLSFGGLRLGRITLPGQAVPPLIQGVLDDVMETGAGNILFDAVRSTTIEADQISLTYRFGRDDISLLKKGLDRVVTRYQPLGDPTLVQLYYKRLMQVGNRQAWNKANRLGEYLAPTFALAAERSAQGHDPVLENRAALLAVSLYCGPPIFEKAIGKVRTGRLWNHFSRCRFTHVGGRHDLALHFMFSAYLRMVSDVAPAFVVGEVKELLDSSRGGSGFSFDDLAADRAGIRLADFALKSKQNARHTQRMFSQSSDDGLYFPKHRDLPAGLTQALFEGVYGSMNDPRYHDMVAKIDARISELPLYAGSKIPPAPTAGPVPPTAP